MQTILSGKRIRIIGVLLTGFLFFQLLVGFNSRDVTPEQRIAKTLNVKLSQFDSYIQDTLLPLAVEGNNENALQNAFLKARQYYKSVEWACEYFTYGTAKFVNGPPKEEAEIAGQTITEPHGLQLMESYLFPHFSRSDKELLLNEVNELQKNVRFFKGYFSGVDLAPWQVLDAAKLEIFRIETLGLTGFDDPLTLHSMSESASALQSVQEVMRLYGLDEQWMRKATEAVAYLRQHSDFNRFDRAYFIRKLANPLSAGIETFVRRKNLFCYKYNRLLRQDAFTLFDSNAFDPQAYSPYLEQQNLTEKIALGKKLFSDVAFSGNGTRSCASCHLPDQAYANTQVLEKAIDGNGFIDRNTPTLLNTALQPEQFYDQRAPDIEHQIAYVVHNPKEMKGSFSNALKILQENQVYQDLYKKAFPENHVMDSASVIESLAAYVRSLVRLNSRFDQYMQGNDNALNAEELDGFNLFMGKAQCATCHYMPLFSGVFPPKYITQDAEIIGVPSISDSKIIDSDKGLFQALLSQGLYGSTQIAPFQYAFKTVSVRNVSQTAPYMQNGVFATLEEVMDFYNKGGGVGEGIAVPNQSLSEKPLQLTPSEIKQIIAFMKSLDSR